MICFLRLVAQQVIDSIANLLKFPVQQQVLKLQLFTWPSRRIASFTNGEECSTSADPFEDWSVCPLLDNSAYVRKEWYGERLGAWL